jgi:arylsulfatase A-like enzyme
MLLALAALWCAGCGSHETQAPRPRNLILISLDTLRADHLGCYGYPEETSPHIDELARQGVLFEQASAPSPWTLPSHASMLTGLYPRSHGVNGWQRAIPKELYTLPEILGEHGFATGGVVNAGVILTSKRGFDLGFESYEVLRPATSVPAGAARSVIVRAMEWLRANKGEPFFLFVHFYDLHADYKSLPDYGELFPSDYEGPADGTQKQLTRYATGHIEGWGEEEARHLARLYDAGVRQLDDRLGRLFEYLKSEGVWEETLIVLTSDHGEEFLDHGSVDHGRTLYEEQLHVPLVLVGPGVPRGLRVAGNVSLIDIVPSALSMLGLPVPEDLEGVDLSRAWREAGAWPVERPMFAEADRWTAMQEGDYKRSVRREHLKLHYLHSSGAKLLFDLSRDPDELEDIAAEHPEVVEALWRELQEFMQGGGLSGEELELSSEELEELQKLGYVQGGG